MSQVIIWQPGQKLYGGRYTIERELGSGGFGITYLARDNQGNQVVIKTLNEKSQKRSDFENIKRYFRNEATRLGYCEHRHIVRIENVFDEGHLHCIVMEYIKGETLMKYVENRGALSESEALQYIQQIGDALAFIHLKGIVHRDVNPNNIIVRSGQSEAVLIDFGTAKEFIPDETQLYTQIYMHGFSPPEQYDRQGKIGDYTDVYALAATLYYLLTRKVPSPACNRGIRDELIPPKQHNPSISDTVNDAILKGMALDAKVDAKDAKEKRSQSVREWLRLLSSPEEIRLQTKNDWGLLISQIMVVALLAISGNTNYLVDLLWRKLNQETETQNIKLSAFAIIAMIFSAISLVTAVPLFSAKPTLVSKEDRFYCVLLSDSNGGGQVWTVMYRSGKLLNPWLKIVSNLSGELTPLKQCDLITQRLETYRQDGLIALEYRSDPGTPGQYFICAKTKLSSESCPLIMPLKPGADPSETLREMTEALRSHSSRIYQ